MTNAIQNLQAFQAAISGATASSPATPQAANSAPLGPQLNNQVGASTVATQLAQINQQAATTRNQQQTQQLRDAIRAINAEYFMAPEGGKVCVWRETRDFELNRPLLVPMTITDFKALYANRKFSFINANGNTTTISLGQAWTTDLERREFLLGMALLPAMTAPPGVYNLWHGWGVTAHPGDVDIPLWHIKHVLCNGDGTLSAYLVCWMAWAVQNPGKQAEVAVVLQGKKGTGKGTLGRWLLDIFGSHGLHILHRRHLIGNFNAHLRSLCFAFADEAFFAGDHEGQAVMKGLITEDQITIERKGVDAFAVRNRLKVLMATNEKWVVPATEDERRYCVIEVSDCKRGNHGYFGDLDKYMRTGGLAALLDYLMNLDLSSFNIRQVPNTEALERQKILSLEPLHAWLYERLWEGSFSTGSEDWEKSQLRARIVGAFTDFVKSSGKRYINTSSDVVGKTLHEVFPSLRDGRESTGRRSRTWVFPDLDQARQEFADYFGLEHVRWPENND